MNTGALNCGAPGAYGGKEEPGMGAGFRRRRIGRDAPGHLDVVTATAFGVESPNIVRLARRQGYRTGVLQLSRLTELVSTKPVSAPGSRRSPALLGF